MNPSSLANGVSRIGNLTFVAGAKIDLSDNKLITNNAVGTAAGGTYDGISGLVQSGRNGGAWNAATGITTSQTVTSNFTAIGVATAAEAKGIAPADTATWAGQTVTGSQTLVMYTYAGDANLDGKINVDDYGKIDSAVVLPGVAGWANGDFNWDGKINVDDYGIIDGNVPIQGAPFFTAGGLGGSSAAAAAGLSGVSAVPEPAMLSVLALGGATLLGRRRRRSR
jgi:hypothetical protein